MLLLYLSLIAFEIHDAAGIKKMRAAGKLAAQVLDFITPKVIAGVSTEQLDITCAQFIADHGAIAAPLNYRGFPKSICTSVNSVVCHGIPNASEILTDGDIINIDVTVILDGYHGDTSRMFTVGTVSKADALLCKRTEQAMLRGISTVCIGASFSEIGKAIEKYTRKFGYGIVREYTGHGIGRVFHADPVVLHCANNGVGAKMREGMTFTIEPMLNASTAWQTQLDQHDGWTVRTADGAKSAQWEHTVLVTQAGAEVLTLSQL